MLPHSKRALYMIIVSSLMLPLHASEKLQTTFHYLKNQKTEVIDKLALTKEEKKLFHTIKQSTSIEAEAFFKELNDKDEKVQEKAFHMLAEK